MSIREHWKISSDLTFVLLKILSAIFMGCLLVAMGLRACQICPEHRINVYLSSLEPEEQV